MKLRGWYVVWGTSDTWPNATDLLDALRPKVRGLQVEYLSDCDPEHWRIFQLRETDSPHPALQVSRFQSGEEEFDLLHSMSVDWVSSCSSELHQEQVMNHLRRTIQFVSVKPILGNLGDAKLARMCEQMCGCLGRNAQGMIQVHQEGFFDLEGRSLLPHCPKHNLKTA